MAETRIKSSEKIDWAQKNRERRSNPEYREKEKKRSRELDKLRRATDPIYVQKRLESHYRYLENSGTKEERRLAYNKKRREQYALKKSLRTPEEKSAALERKRLGFLRWNKQIL